MSHNILITSAGRRVDLIQNFKNSLILKFPGSKVFTADSKPHLSAACQISDKAFLVSNTDSKNYLYDITKICIDNKIGLVIPTIDSELLFFSKAKEKFLKEGIKIVVSSESIVELSSDKRKTIQIFEKYKLNYPKIYKKDNLEFPCFCKPYDGSRSEDTYVINSKLDLNSNIINNPKNIFMEMIPPNYTEFTIDAYFDINSILKCLVPRERIEIRDGEVSKSATRKNFIYNKLINSLSKLDGAHGCISIQCFADLKTEDMKFFEINPRFSGGFPLTSASGADFPSWLIDEYFLNKEIPFFDSWEPNLLMLRYDSKILKNDYE